MFFVAENNFIVYIHHVFFTHVPVVGHLGWSHNLPIVNNDGVNIAVQDSPGYADFVPSGRTPRSSIAGSNDRSIFIFSKGTPY